MFFERWGASPKNALTLLLASSQREEERLLPINLSKRHFNLGSKAPPLPLGEGWGEGRSIFNLGSSQNLTQHTISILQNLMIPKT